jgi:hypothetical protein
MTSAKGEAALKMQMEQQLNIWSHNQAAQLADAALLCRRRCTHTLRDIARGFEIEDFRFLKRRNSAIPTGLGNHFDCPTHH